MFYQIPSLNYINNKLKVLFLSAFSALYLTHRIVPPPMNQYYNSDLKVDKEFHSSSNLFIF